MFPIIYGDLLPGETADNYIRGGVRMAGIYIDCDPNGGISVSGGDGSSGTGGAPKQPSAPVYRMTCAIAFCDSRVAPTIIDQVFLNEKCKFDRFGSTSALKGWNVSPEYDPRGNTISEIGDKLELYRGTAWQHPSATLQAIHSPNPVPAYRWLSYIVMNQVAIQNSVPTITIVGRNSITGAQVIVTKHLQLAGLPAERINLSNLAAANVSLRGAIQNNEGAAKDLCNQVARYAGCDLAEWDGLIQDYARNFQGAPQTLDGAFLAARVGDKSQSSTQANAQANAQNAPDKLKTGVDSDRALHSYVALHFSDIDRNWDSNLAPANRFLATHHNPGSLEYGIVAHMSDMEPRARLWLDEEWAERFKFQLNVPIQFLLSTPGSVWIVPAPTEIDPNATQTIRLQNQRLGLTMHWEAVSYDPSIYVAQPAYGGGSTSAGIAAVATTGLPTLFLCDPSALPNGEAATTDGRIIAGACASQTTAWGGAAILWNPTPATLPATGSLQPQGMVRESNFSNEATIGTLTTALGATGATFDYSSTVRVTMISGGLAAATEDHVTRGANVLLVKEPDGSDGLGTGRLLQWTTATVVSPGVYDLSGLRNARGVVDTLPAIATGALCLLLSDENGGQAAGVVSIVVPRALLGSSQSYIETGSGADAPQSTTQNIVVVGRSALPTLSAVQTPQVVSGAQNGSNTTFAVPSTIRAGTEMVFVNGLKIRSGSDKDYTLSADGKSVVFNAGNPNIPGALDSLEILGILT